MHPKLDPRADLCTCADTKLMWATRRATNDIVDMSLIFGSKLLALSHILEFFPKFFFKSEST